ncbi:hypothetical protein RB11732 [Rhodopirellula baltica SH 1]|uniref:Uncharacterized protein n=1 Tax=Rhodopirellula baltica (strain DSM 10527 / NCIMB 13988 / SH1) TaxID=243090 RepID=Q7UDW7_RHOBA|nr:hypothetical protein RB11732 [Rhodopirellula baltica SH 1]
MVTTKISDRFQPEISSRKMSAWISRDARACKLNRNGFASPTPSGSHFVGVLSSLRFRPRHCGVIGGELVFILGDHRRLGFATSPNANQQECQKRLCKQRSQFHRPYQSKERTETPAANGREPPMVPVLSLQALKATFHDIEFDDGGSQGRS